MLVIRTLQGLGFGGEWAVGAALMAEVIRPEHRGKALGFVQSGFALGWGGRRGDHDRPARPAAAGPGLARSVLGRRDSGRLRAVHPPSRQGSGDRPAGHRQGRGKGLDAVGLPSRGDPPDPARRRAGHRPASCRLHHHGLAADATVSERGPQARPGDLHHADHVRGAPSPASWSPFGSPTATAAVPPCCCSASARGSSPRSTCWCR
ncbi:MFS transporter [Pseudomonas aeruginosa]|uniref:MFS transporter n=1 Tax=Pseudomonas aeruginosa TaxID=287 RepID=UPI0037B759C7